MTGPHDRTRRSYDAVAGAYADGLRDELAGKPLDRALLTALIEQSQLEPAAAGPVVGDLGCGPGHIAGWLAAHGATAVGVDLSAGMIEVARREQPGAEFRVGDLLSLPAADGEFGAVVAFYSIIHLAPGELPAALAEMHRVVRPGGLALLAFHIGTDVRHFSDWLGHQVDVDFRFYEPDDVAALLEAAGFTVAARLERRAYPAEVDTRRAYLLAARPG
ncbi:MAG TPA: class I SAM-dependent methyltransferase [Streptosporangiaceae bacterium]|nr:class I SAM-dependent methyltransferase [Streptosporangiaceae bacterium]